MAKQTRAAENDFEPVTFTKSDERGEHTLTAHTPAEVVKLRFDGWKEQKASTASSTKTAAAGPSKSGTGQ